MSDVQSRFTQLFLMLRFVSTVANGFAFQGSATDWWATPCYAVSQQGTCTCAVHVVVTLVFAVTSTQQWLCIPQWWLNRVSFDFLSNKRCLGHCEKRHRKFYVVSNYCTCLCCRHFSNGSEWHNFLLWSVWLGGSEHQHVNAKQLLSSAQVYRLVPDVG